jgi:hypothetical protein
MPLLVLAQVLGSLGQAYVAAVAALDPVQDFIHAGPPGEAAKLCGQELLQGLALALGALLKGGVDVLGQVPDEQIRHAYIMQALVAAGQIAAASRTTPTRLSASKRTLVTPRSASVLDVETSS